jgi:soluble lytic murein transglycosylase-like protein
MRRARIMVSIAGAALAGGVAAAGPRAGDAAPFSTEVERCIVPASQFHGVNPHVLRAILKVESGLKPTAVGRNANGTMDVGLGQMNSMHFAELKARGVQPSQLFDPCVATYVAAWHLKQNIAQHGNTWTGIASYHSQTPYFNRRYQIMLNNELVRSGAMPGVILSVPPLRGDSAAALKSGKASPAGSSGSAVVIDDARK